MKIVYIGPKAKKIDMTTGSRQVFPRFEAIEVEKEYAHRLLRYPTVYIEEKNLPAIKKQMQEKEAQTLAKKEAAAAAIKKEQEDASRVVTFNGQDEDLRKYTQIKLETLVESEDLEVSPKLASEKVSEFCDRVYLAFKTKQTATGEE